MCVLCHISTTTASNTVYSNCWKFLSGLLFLWVSGFSHNKLNPTWIIWKIFCFVLLFFGRKDYIFTAELFTTRSLSFVCECTHECAVGKFVLVGHLDHCGAHGMRVPLLSLALVRFAEYFFKRNTPTSAGISTLQHLNLPLGLHC